MKNLSLAFSAAKRTLLLLLPLFWLSVAVSEAASLPDFAELVEKNAPAIVNIATIQRVSVRPGGRSNEIEELLRRLSPEDALPPELQQERTRPRGGVGSGFIISDDGYLITNHHVVTGADQITVTLNDRRVFTAEVVGTDELSDMALLKIDARNLPSVIFGDSEDVRVGEWVLAIGSPFGLEFSAAAGIVSAKGRTVPGNQTSYVSFIQTDVAINQGNSGGPLFNLDGEVIGINSQILSSSGGSNGVSFAIPSNVALNVVEQLRESGSVSRGLLGVMIKDVDYALAEAFDMPRPRGAFVDEVQPGSPAENAGVENNDIILTFNDREIESSSQLPFYVGQVRPGTIARLSIMRDGKIITLPVTVGSLPGSGVTSTSEPQEAPRTNSLGLTVTELSEEAQQVSGISGVRVDELLEGPAERAGLMSGDVIVELNRSPVPSLSEFARVANALPETGYIPIRIVREGRGTTLVLELK
ncbi:MAG: Do family serine endopeptidase [Gammaproteobacteria bacterium]|nr:Do family serine endopeptidase [Gammaproteobacteria bacterium]MDP2140928.1 Do family serine endopeptidase [Gammaproteobacteria bacterium]MDP2349328.1 Do family serine endopeptidase [Gammaproteobacteria bacterium]